MDAAIFFSKSGSVCNDCVMSLADADWFSSRGLKTM